MRKVEHLPTRDCEAGYGPESITLLLCAKAKSKNVTKLVKIHYFIDDVVNKQSG